MVLRNFYNMIACAVLGVEQTDIGIFGDGHLNLKTYDGTVINRQKYYSKLCFGIYEADKYVYGNSEYGGVAIFGTGDTPVTFDDYTLASFCGDLTFGNVIHNDVTYNSTEKKFSTTKTFTITNPTASSITLKEIGINGTARGQYNDTGVLVYREVFATPITLAAGESITYTHNFEFTMPTIT